MTKPRRNANPFALRDAGAFPSLVNGQFVNPHGQPKKVGKGGPLAVECPTSRGKRYVETIDMAGDGETSR